MVLRGNVRSSFQVDFAAAAKGGGGREVEEKRGRGSKQGSSGPNLPGKQRPTRESLCPTVPYTECRMLAHCCSTGCIVSSNRMAARRACSWPWHHHPPSSPAPPPPPLDSTKALFSDRQLATEAAHSRFPPNVSPDLLLPIHCLYAFSFKRGEMQFETFAKKHCSDFALHSVLYMMCV